jgi:hypothetical protein
MSMRATEEEEVLEQKMSIDELLHFAIKSNMEESYAPEVIAFVGNRAYDIAGEVCACVCEKGKGENFAPDDGIYELKIDSRKVGIQQWDFNEIGDVVEEFLALKEDIDTAIRKCGERIGEKIFASEEFAKFREEVIRKNIKRESKKRAREERKRIEVKPDD